MTDEETYLTLKELEEQGLIPYLNTEEWKKLRLIQLKKEGKAWK
jgi:hypothetical protein